MWGYGNKETELQRRQRKPAVNFDLPGHCDLVLWKVASWCSLLHAPMKFERSKLIETKIQGPPKNLTWCWLSQKHITVTYSFGMSPEVVQCMHWWALKGLGICTLSICQYVPDTSTCSMIIKVIQYMYLNCLIVWARWLTFWVHNPKSTGWVEPRLFIISSHHFFFISISLLPIKGLKHNWNS